MTYPQGREVRAELIARTEAILDARDRGETIVTSDETTAGPPIVVTDAMVEAAAEVVYDLTTVNYHTTWSDISGGDDDYTLDDTDRSTAETCRHMARTALEAALAVAPGAAADGLDAFAAWFDEQADPRFDVLPGIAHMTVMVERYRSTIKAGMEGAE